MPQLRWRPYDDWPRRMARLVLVMCAPWLAVLPVGAYHFGVIHPYGAVLTLIASPVLSLILPILWASVFLGLEFPQLASLVGDVMVPALIALQWILESLSTLPWVQISTNFFRPDAAPTTALMTIGVLCLIAGRFRWSISALAFGLLCSPDLGFDRGEKDAFRWDVLSVGNGSAHLPQMGSEAGRLRREFRGTPCLSPLHPSGPSHQNIRSLKALFAPMLTWITLQVWCRSCEPSP